MGEVKSIKNSTEQISKKTVNVKKTTSNNTSSSPVAKKISKKIKNNENLGKENSSNNKVNKVKVPFDFKAQKQKRLSPALAVICGKKQMGNNDLLTETHDCYQIEIIILYDDLSVHFKIHFT